MNASHRAPRDSDAGDDHEQPAAASPAEEDARAAGQPTDWQVLLLRYLPQPMGSSHVIKRLASR